MDNSQKRKRKARRKRVMRVRKKIRGTASCPRLSVSKTNLHLYAQLIDDERGVTLAGVGTLSKGNRGTPRHRKSKEAAKELGKQMGVLAKQRDIETVVFDRGRFQYHGVIAALAEGAREAGLRF